MKNRKFEVDWNIFYNGKVESHKAALGQCEYSVSQAKDLFELFRLIAEVESKRLMFAAPTAMSIADVCHD